MPTTIQYTIDADGTFPNKRADLKKLKRQLKESATTALNTVSDVVGIDGNAAMTFGAASLTVQEQASLYGIVRAHDGIPLATREFSEVLVDTTSNSTAFVDLLTVTCYVGDGEQIIVTAAASNDSSGNNQTFYRVLLNGVAQRGGGGAVANGKPCNVGINLRRQPGIGSHVVTLQWRQSNGTGRLNVVTNPDTCFASLLVQVVPLVGP